MQVINGIYSHGLQNPTKRAAMYYKTEPLVRGVGSYHHTNNWEIIRAIQILNSKGYIVDLIDRGNSNWHPTCKYDLFLGLGVGNSGKRFAEYAKRSNASTRILLAMGPQPDISNENTIKRYLEFSRRTGVNAPPMRTVSDVCGPAFLEIMENTDFIFCIGENQNAAYKSFEKYGKKILPFYPAVSDKVSYDKSWASTRLKNEFLCFAGNGLICKGVDVVLEAFMRDETKTLHICGPAEKSFFDAYQDKISMMPNVNYHGFIEPGGKKFNELASRCSYVVFHSSSEGCCTSVATAMKAGLVPIINEWTGINITNEGFLLRDAGINIIDEVQSVCESASKIDEEKYSYMLHATLEKSRLFSQESFTVSYESAILEVIQ